MRRTANDFTWIPNRWQTAKIIGVERVPLENKTRIAIIFEITSKNDFLSDKKMAVFVMSKFRIQIIGDILRVCGLLEKDKEMFPDNRRIFSKGYIAVLNKLLTGQRIGLRIQHFRGRFNISGIIPRDKCNYLRRKGIVCD